MGICKIMEVQEVSMEVQEESVLKELLSSLVTPGVIKVNPTKTSIFLSPNLTHFAFQIYSISRHMLTLLIPKPYLEFQFNLSCTPLSTHC